VQEDSGGRRAACAMVSFGCGSASFGGYDARTKWREIVSRQTQPGNEKGSHFKCHKILSRIYRVLI
jgi:hypothetical protein